MLSVVASYSITQFVVPSARPWRPPGKTTTQHAARRAPWGEETLRCSPDCSSSYPHLRIQRPRPRAISENHEARSAEQHHQLVSPHIPDRTARQMHLHKRDQELARPQQPRHSPQKPQDQEPPAHRLQPPGNIGEICRKPHVDEVLRPMAQTRQLPPAMPQKNHAQRQPQQRQCQRPEAVAKPTQHAPILACPPCFLDPVASPCSAFLGPCIIPAGGSVAT